MTKMKGDAAACSAACAPEDPHRRAFRRIASAARRCPALAAAVTAAALAAAEVLLRLLALIGDPASARAKYLNLPPHPKPKPWHEADPRYGYALKAGYADEGIIINRFGSRSARPDLDASKHPDTFRCVFLGDGFFFGPPSQNDTFPARMEEVMNRRFGGGKRFEAVNDGVDGHLSKHSLQRLASGGIFDLDPDLLVICSGINDVFESDPSEPFLPLDFERFFPEDFEPRRFIGLPIGKPEIVGFPLRLWKREIRPHFMPRPSAPPKFSPFDAAAMRRLVADSLPADWWRYSTFSHVRATPIRAGADGERGAIDIWTSWGRSTSQFVRKFPEAPAGCVVGLRARLLEGGFGIIWTTPDMKKTVSSAVFRKKPHTEPLFKDCFLTTGSSGDGTPGGCLIVSNESWSGAYSHMQISEVIVSDSALRRSGEPVPREAFAHLVANLRAMIRMARARSVPAVLCTLPAPPPPAVQFAPESGGDDRMPPEPSGGIARGFALPGFTCGDAGYMKEIIERCNEEIRAMAKRESVPLLDLAAFVSSRSDRELMFLSYEIPSAAGAALIAEYAAGRLGEIIAALSPPARDLQPSRALSHAKRDKASTNCGLVVQ